MVGVVRVQASPHQLVPVDRPVVGVLAGPQALATMAVSGAGAHTQRVGPQHPITEQLLMLAVVPALPGRASRLLGGGRALGAPTLRHYLGTTRRTADLVRPCHLGTPNADRLALVGRGDRPGADSR